MQRDTMDMHEAASSESLANSSLLTRHRHIEQILSATAYLPSSDKYPELVKDLNKLQDDTLLILRQSIRRR